VAKEIFLEANDWDITKAFQFAKNCLEKGSKMESKLMGIFYLEHWKEKLKQCNIEEARSYLNEMKNWLLSNLCNNWLLVDSLCSCIISPLLGSFHSLADDLKLWSTSNNLWVKRTSAVSFVLLAPKKEVKLKRKIYSLL
jgi:3-methyladenine DNA glycosylase AlkD